jgi:hypothetical protein
MFSPTCKNATANNRFSSTKVKAAGSVNFSASVQPMTTGLRFQGIPMKNN